MRCFNPKGNILSTPVDISSSVIIRNGKEICIPNRFFNRQALRMYGFLIIDKPAGITSAGAMNSVKRLLPRGVKLATRGHSIHLRRVYWFCLIGKATKRCEELMGQPKQYEGTIRLGATTETDDPESVRANRRKRYANRRNGSARCVGAIYWSHRTNAAGLQRPENCGQRACDRIRAGETVVPKPRLVHMDDISLLDYAWPDAKVRIDCGRGTYIRAIARDLGKKLGVGGYLTQLRRTRSGPFKIDRAVTLERLRADGVERYVIDS